MRRTLSPRVLAGAALAVAMLSCGEVPTLPDGIAYISTIILPAPAVALGDTMRDATGKATPLRIDAFGQDGEPIPVDPTYVVTTVPGKSATVTAVGFVIGDSLRSVRVVGRVGDRLQTPAATFDVVRQPDSIAATVATKIVLGPVSEGEVFSISSPLTVLVSSGATAIRSAIRGIIVQYAVTRIFPASAAIPDTTIVLIDDANRFALPTGRLSVDTTDAQGQASRRLRAPPFGYDSVEVEATARNLKGIPLKGSPVRFIISTR
jgi:hypothetical protein